jgi:hypothetical protein
VKQPFAGGKKQPSFLLPCDSQRELLLQTNSGMDNVDDDQAAGQSQLKNK